MPRPIDPRAAYRVVPHTTHGHTYASVQRTVTGKDGKNRRRHWHLGVLDGNKFTPWADFLALPGEERERFVFPPEWDLSFLDRLSNRRGQGRPKLEGEPLNRLYGDVWLLERIAESTGVRHDLEVVFEGNGEMVDAVLALAMFPYLTKFSFSRVARWQRIVKSPCDFPLTPRTITALTQSITERHRQEFLALRAKSLKSGELCAVDSTSRSTYGDSLADIRWGKSKDHLPLEQVLSVVVYTLSSHMPVYYRIFPGNMPDSRSLDVILKDLDDAGFRDLALVTDRGYDSLRNVERYIRRGQAMLMSVKVGQAFVMDRIRQFGAYDSCPDAMSVDGETGLACFQCDLDCEVEATNSRSRKADRLKLNIYLDVRRRAEILVRLRIGIESQRKELEAMLGKATLPDGGADGDGCRGACHKRSYGYYRVSCEPDTGVVKSFELSEGKVARIRLLAGYFASVTHRLDFSPMEAYRHYRLRDEQEKYFQLMRDQMAADRLRCWSEEGWTGRQLILFVGLVLSSYARHVWKKELSGKFSSSLEMLDEMRDIRCIEHPGHARKITPFVGAQLDICRAFGFEPPKGCAKEYVSIQKAEKKRGRPRKKLIVSDND